MLIKTNLPPLAYIVLYLVLIAAACLIILGGMLPVYVLIALVIPVPLSAFFYKRWVYLTLAGLLTITAVLIPLQLLMEPSNLLVIIPLTLISTILVSESIIQRTQAARRLEESLRQSGEQTARMVENSADGILLINEDGEMLDWNHSMERITGIKRTDVVGKPSWEVFFRLQPEENKTRAAYERIKSGIVEINRTGDIQWPYQIVERIMQRPDGSQRITQELPFAIKNSKGSHLGYVIRDVTDLKNAERALRQANDSFKAHIQVLEQRNREANLLNEMGDLLQSCLNVEDAYAVMKQFAEKIFLQQSGVLYVLSDRVNQYEAVAWWGNPLLGEMEFSPDGCWSLRRGARSRGGRPR